MESISNLLSKSPIIPACRSDKQLEDALCSEVNVIFLLESNISNFKEKIEAIKAVNKYAFVHFDLINGLSQDNSALEYLVDQCHPHGIITTRKNLIMTGKKLGLYTIQRMFLIDTTSITSAISMAKNTKPDAIEILPGIAPKVIRAIKNKIETPIITGGLITNSVEIVNALKAGAVGVSVSRQSLWSSVE
ncbi:glycerol-3-phosphate responsive antiterminator [Alkalibaculum sporogenes]|nr:glycerol-3-phosphate responsive antiterminator [Alkalibaculum sporogenes]